MPTYSYQCKDCGHRYDAFQSMKADPDTVCPECNGTVERLIGAGAGIVFKGSGFYVTDYRKDSGGKDNSSKQGASGSSAPKSDTSSSGNSGSSNGTSGGAGTSSAAPAASSNTSSA